MHDLLSYLLTVCAGAAAGFINTLAGSGSAFSLAALNALGLPLDVANGTNRVAIILQTLVAVLIFKRKGRMPAFRITLPMIVPAVFGAVAGALLAGSMERDVFRTAVGVLMLLVLGLLFIKPKVWLEQRESLHRRPYWIVGPVFFLIGVYGGFIQMGIGVFLLTALVLMSGFDLVTGNAVKVLIVLVLTAPALAIFAAQGLVRWDAGLILACGNMLGAWLAAREAARRGAVFIRWLLIAVVTIAAARYLGLLS